MNVSVIICSHNPRVEALSRTLNGLRNQDLATSYWELIVVDNASDHPLQERFDLSWHPNGRHITETELGLTPARLCGIRHANAPLLLFVDDDNVLCPHYLSEGLKISEKYPFLGAWGGSQVAEYEKEPPPKLLKHMDMIAIRSVDREIWSNQYDWRTTPAGAGMAVRTHIARSYMEKLATNELMKGLDRKGESLASGGDIDMAYTAIDSGYGCGLFPSLYLHHLIPAGRTNEDYLIRLKAGITYSGVIVGYQRGLNAPVKRLSGFALFLYQLKQRFTRDMFEYKLWKSEFDARDRAYRDLDLYLK